MTFLKKNNFLFSQSQVYGYPRNPLAIVVAWVPITGVYKQFLGASGPIKKKQQNFAVFKFGFFAKNAPKCAKKKKIMVHNHF